MFSVRIQDQGHQEEEGDGGNFGGRRAGHTSQEKEGNN